MSIAALSNTTFAVSMGNEEVKVWSQMRMPGEGENQPAKMGWSVISALKYRNFSVKQLVPNTRLRLTNV